MGLHSNSRVISNVDPRGIHCTEQTVQQLHWSKTVDGFHHLCCIMSLKRLRGSKDKAESSLNGFHVQALVLVLAGGQPPRDLPRAIISIYMFLKEIDRKSKFMIFLFITLPLRCELTFSVCVCLSRSAVAYASRNCHQNEHLQHNFLILLNINKHAPKTRP